MPLVTQQLGHRWSQNGSGGTANGHAQGIPGNHTPHLVVEVTLDEAGQQGAGNGDSCSHGHRAANQHGTGMAAQTRQ
ncbi:hypothetical protein D3C85_1674240 [compost metagenome]